MKTFSSYINEALDKPVSFKLLKVDKDSKAYTFTTGGRTYNAHLMKDTEGEWKAVGIAFDDLDNTGNLDDIINSTKSSMAVFATLGAILKSEKEWIGDLPIQFEASVKNTSRIKLYDSLAKRIATQIGGKITAHRMGSYKIYRIK
jgi:hypothetical protein